MIQPILRAAGVALLGAVVGAVSVALAFTTHPDIALEMDRDLPQNISGVYSPERAQDVTFAWTSGRAELALKGMNRDAPWVCSVRFRGGRAAPTPQPVVDVAIDGIRLASSTATNEYQEIEITAPPSERRGLILTMDVAPTAVPGPQDPRQLGVQLDRLACRPAGAAALPPRGTLASAALSGAIFGAAFSLINVTAGMAAGAALLLAVAQAAPLSIGLAPYVDHGGHAIRLAVWIGLAMVLTARCAEWWSGRRLRNTARFVIAFSAAVLYLQLLALSHPSKALVDAVFQAHRFQAVLAGRLLFTQGMPSGVQFPYAIGLYVFSAPWSVLTANHVTLLRIVVCASQVIAGGLVYLLVVRTWGDRLSGAIAAALFSLVPMKYLFIGAANLTNVFGESVAVATVAALTLLPLRQRQWVQVLVVTLLATWAFLCHVGTFATLFVTLSVVTLLYWRLGGPSLRGPAHHAFIVTAAAVLLSVATYYGHFGAVYKDALRIRSQGPPAAAQSAQPGGDETATPATKYRAFTPLHIRVFDALMLTVEMVGWPILALAAVGGWRAWTRRARDRLMFAVLAWTTTSVVFFSVGVMRVDVQFQRFSYEFVGRVAFATYPAAVILAGYGAVWAWQAGKVARVISAALLLFAVRAGVESWLGWMR
jgi:hypothetical protein